VTITLRQVRILPPPQNFYFMAKTLKQTVIDELKKQMTPDEIKKFNERLSFMEGSQKALENYYAEQYKIKGNG